MRCGVCGAVMKHKNFMYDLHSRLPSLECWKCPDCGTETKRRIKDDETYWIPLKYMTVEVKPRPIATYEYRFYLLARLRAWLESRKGYAVSLGERSDWTVRLWRVRKYWVQTFILEKEVVA